LGERWTGEIIGIFRMEGGEKSRDLGPGFGKQERENIVVIRDDHQVFRSRREDRGQSEETHKKKNN